MLTLWLVAAFFAGVGATTLLFALLHASEPRQSVQAEDIDC